MMWLPRLRRAVGYWLRPCLPVFSLHRFAALVIVAALLAPVAIPIRAQAKALTTPPIRMSLTASLSAAALAVWHKLSGSTQEGDEMPESYLMPPVIEPEEPSSQSLLLSSVANLELESEAELTLDLDENSVLLALPVDTLGNAVQGVSVGWVSSDSEVASVTSDGEVTANAEGTAILTASAGGHNTTVEVTVTNTQAVPINDPLPDNETDSLYTTSNSIGSPPGRTTQGAATAAAATSGTERPGSSNFTFDVPIISLPGRGLDVSLGLTYNSRVWNASTAGSGENMTARLTYDVDSGWPAPGFRLGYGQLESQTFSGYTLIDPDGTRHKLTEVMTGIYESTDGTFIRYNAATHIVTYTDGTQVRYAAAGGGKRSYPIKITDRHGNFINITYVGNVGPKINTVQDTLLRVVRFYYDATSGELIRITAPTYNNQTGGDGCVSTTACRERTVVRFFYANLNLNGSFANGITISKPATTQRGIQYIYFPDTGAFAGEGSGFSYAYSSYGMIYKINKLQEMKLSTDGASIATSKIAATTDYSYPGTPSTPPPANGLLGVPTYTQRTDWWVGRATANPLPPYIFEVSEGQGFSKITSPDGTVTETRTITDENNPNFGLVYEIVVRESLNGPELSKVSTTWDPGTNGHNPRPLKIERTNEVRQKEATVFSEYDEFNNAGIVSEYNFGAADGPAGAELRRTVTTYQHQTQTAYQNRRLVHLPKQVEIYEGGASNRLMSRTDYDYDTAVLTGYNNIKMHDPNYNADKPETAKRGNLTKVTTYPDVANTANKITNTISYDVAGNVLSETSGCCQLKRYTYTFAYHYAYPEQETRGPLNGPQLSTSFMYDRSTGLVRKVTDTNGQATNFDYWPRSLHLSQTTRPDGSWVRDIYDDRLYFINAQYKHSALVTQAGLTTDINGAYVSNYQYLDGRGAVIRSLVGNNAQGYLTTDTVYDDLGRVAKTSNPYSASLALVGPPSTVLWTTLSYDHLGRVVTATMPGNTGVVTTEYNGQVTTVTDQAERKRRQVVDGLSVRVDEPDKTTGNLGTTTSAVQSTTYRHDVLGNLVQITQGDQERYFKYDSLSRLTHERHVEQAAPYTNIPDVLTGNSAWSSKYVYNTDDLLTDSYDARQVHTQFVYDDLNRLETINYSNEVATNGITTPTVTYTYGDSAPSFNKGRLIKVATSTIGTTVPLTEQNYVYDRIGQITSQTEKVGSNSYTLSYSYNKLGQLLTEKYPSGRVVTYDYDNRVRLAGMRDATRTYLSNLTYGAHGGLESVMLGNGAVQSFGYNSRLQLSSTGLTKANITLQRYDYKYGVVNPDGTINETQNTGQVASVEGYIGVSAGPPTKQWQQRHTYDKLGRLSKTEETRGDTGALSYRMAYTYDRYGNRFQSGNQNIGLDFTPVLNSQIDTQTNRFTSSTNIAYDAAGNITTDQKFRNAQYKYDANGRQRWAKNLSLDTEADSIYDGVGQRVAIKEGSVWRYTVYDIFGQMVAEYGGAASDESGVRYVMSDNQGSTRALTNANGAVTARHDYLPFGEEIGAGIGQRTPEQKYGAGNKTRQRYTGLERDEVSKLDHTLWRKYESRAGRWTTPDPYKGSMSLNDPQSSNRYSYVQNDPVNFVDPSGLLWLLNCTFRYSIFLPDGGPRVADVFECGIQEIDTLPGNRGIIPFGGQPRFLQDKKKKKQLAKGPDWASLNKCVDDAYGDYNRRVQAAETAYNNAPGSYLPTSDDFGRGLVIGLATQNPRAGFGAFAASYLYGSLGPKLDAVSQRNKELSDAAQDARGRIKGCYQQHGNGIQPPPGSLP